MPTSYAEWPQDVASVSPAKEVAEAIKLAQKTAGSRTKMKVTVCQSLDGENGDILFFPPKLGNFTGPRAYRGAANTAAVIGSPYLIRE